MQSTGIDCITMQWMYVLMHLACCGRDHGYARDIYMKCVEIKPELYLNYIIFSIHLTYYIIEILIWTYTVYVCIYCIYYRNIYIYIYIYNCIIWHIYIVPSLITIRDVHCSYIRIVYCVIGILIVRTSTLCNTYILKDVYMTIVIQHYIL